MADFFATSTSRASYSGHMTARIDLIGVVVDDMPRALDFYRRLGLEIPDEADSEPHVEASLPGGLRIAWDTTETIRSFDPEWTPPSGGHGSAWHSAATARPRSTRRTPS
jgi:catechol 2,3-dioxygenase-like lactoylglutathione lyase family enzyme